MSIPTPRPDSIRPWLPIRSGAAPIWSASAIAWSATPRGRAGFRISIMDWAGAAGFSRRVKGPGGKRQARPAATSTWARPAGIGAWTDQEIGRAIPQGIARDGRTLKPPMAYNYNAGLKESDLADVIAYLRKVPPLQ